MKIYVVDIDGTICNNTYGEYEKAKPFLERIQYINFLFNVGMIRKEDWGLPSINLATEIDQ